MPMYTRRLHFDNPACYCISAQGLLDPCWLDTFSGVWVIYSQQSNGPGITLLLGEVRDQAALVGVIEQLYSLGFPLLLVEHLVVPEERVLTPLQNGVLQPACVIYD